MSDHPMVEQSAEFVASVLSVIGGLWAVTKYVLQPAYKIAQSEERARQYRLTVDAYKLRLDEMVQHIDALTHQVREQTKRADMLLLYVAESSTWERFGRRGERPILPPELEAAVYDLATRIKKEGV